MESSTASKESSTASDAANIGFHDYPNLKDVGDLKNVSTKMPINGDNAKQGYSDWQHMTCKSYVLPMLHPSNLDALLNDRPNIRINPSNFTVRELIAAIQSQYDVVFDHTHRVSDELRSRENLVDKLKLKIQDYTAELGLKIDDAIEPRIDEAVGLLKSNLIEAKRELVEAKEHLDAFPRRIEWSYKIPHTTMDKEKLFLMKLGAMLHISVLAYEDDMKAYKTGGFQALADRYASFMGDQRFNADDMITPHFAALIDLQYKDWDGTGTRYPRFGQIYTFVPAPIVLLLHLRYPIPFHVLDYSAQDINTFDQYRQEHLQGDASIFPSPPQLQETLKKRQETLKKKIAIMSVWTEAGFLFDGLYLKKVSPTRGVFEDSMWNADELPEKDEESRKKYFMKHTWNNNIFACISPGFAEWLVDHRTTFRNMVFLYNKYTAHRQQPQSEPIALGNDSWDIILSNYASTFTAMD